MDIGSRCRLIAALFLFAGTASATTVGLDTCYGPQWSRRGDDLVLQCIPLVTPYKRRDKLILRGWYTRCPVFTITPRPQGQAVVCRR